MNLSELLWTIAYCTFLTGAAWSFRSNGAWSAIVVMGCGALLDLLVALLPQLGVKALQYGPAHFNRVTLVALVAGLLVYVSFLFSVGFRWKGRYALFHAGIAVTQVLWFLSFIGFLYGLYIVPPGVTPATN